MKIKIILLLGGVCFFSNTGFAGFDEYTKLEEGYEKISKETMNILSPEQTQIFLQTLKIKDKKQEIELKKIQEIWKNQNLTLLEDTVIERTNNFLKLIGSGKTVVKKNPQIQDFSSSADTEESTASSDDSTLVESIKSKNERDNSAITATSKVQDSKTNEKHNLKVFTDEESEEDTSCTSETPTSDDPDSVKPNFSKKNSSELHFLLKYRKRIQQFGVVLSPYCKAAKTIFKNEHIDKSLKEMQPYLTRRIKFHTGDILNFSGTGAVSDTIKNVTKFTLKDDIKLSHVGLVVVASPKSIRKIIDFRRILFGKNKKSISTNNFLAKIKNLPSKKLTTFCFHSTGHSGVHLDLLSDVIAEYNGGNVYARRLLSPVKPEKILFSVLKYLEKPYASLDKLSRAPWGWNSSFEPDSLFCSELVAAVLLVAGVLNSEVLPNNYLPSHMSSYCNKDVLKNLAYPEDLLRISWMDKNLYKTLLGHIEKYTTDDSEDIPLI